MPLCLISYANYTIYSSRFNVRLPPQCRRAGGACWFRNASLNRLTLVNQVTNSFHRFLCWEGNICSCCTTSTWTGADRAQLPSQHPKSSRMRPASVPKSASHGKVAVPHQKVRLFIREQGQTYPCLAAPTYGDFPQHQPKTARAALCLCPYKWAFVTRLLSWAGAGQVSVTIPVWHH